MAGLAEAAGGRPDQHERAAAARRKRAEKGPGGEEGRSQVERDRPFEPREVHVADCNVLRGIDACDRGAGPERPDRLVRVREKPVDLILDRQVSPGDRCAAELLRERPCPLLAAVVVDDHPRVLGRKRARTGRPDPPGGAGDDHAQSCQPGVHGGSLRGRTSDAWVVSSTRTWRAALR